MFIKVTPSIVPDNFLEDYVIVSNYGMCVCVNGGIHIPTFCTYEQRNRPKPGCEGHLAKPTGNIATGSGLVPGSSKPSS